MPALHGAVGNPHDALQEARARAERRRSGARSVLVAAEVAVAILLLVGAGLTLRSFDRLTR